MQHNNKNHKNKTETELKQKIGSNKQTSILNFIFSIFKYLNVF